MQACDGHAFTMAIIHRGVRIVHPLQHRRGDCAVIIGEPNACFVSKQAPHVIGFEVHDIGCTCVIFKGKAISFDVKTAVRYNIGCFDGHQRHATRGERCTHQQKNIQKYFWSKKAHHDELVMLGMINYSKKPFISKHQMGLHVWHCRDG